MSRSALLAAAFVVAFALPAAAQDLDVFQRANEEARLGSNEPFVRLTVDGAWGDPADGFAFFSYWDRPHGDPQRRRGLAIRKASRTESDPTWANSLDCPQVEALVVALEEVEPPRVDVMGLGREFPMRMTADGATFALWARWPTWDGLVGYELRMSGNYGSPLADWAQRLYRDLDGCWAADAPDAV